MWRTERLMRKQKKIRSEQARENDSFFLLSKVGSKNCGQQKKKETKKKRNGKIELNKQLNIHKLIKFFLIFLKQFFSLIFSG